MISFEPLEQRTLLAVDTLTVNTEVATPWHNALNPGDVSHDGRVNTSDLLLIFNDLLRHGPRAVPTEAMPLGTAGDSTLPPALDVTGDNRVNSSDALQLINFLLATDKVSISLRATDLQGNPITSTTVGSTFMLEAFAQDIQSPASASPGIFEAYVDVGFNPSIVAPDSASVSFGPTFDLIPRFEFLSSEQFRAGGTSTSLTATGGGPLRMWTVEVQALSSGVAAFTPTFTIDTDMGVLLYGQNERVLGHEIVFTGVELEVVGQPSITVNDVSIAEGDAGSMPLVFTVALSSAVTEPVVVTYFTEEATAFPGVDYVHVSGTATFAPGDTTAFITVSVLGDTLPESHEQFLLRLVDPLNATLARDFGLGTIIDDDSPIGPSIISVTDPITSANQWNVSISGSAEPWSYVDVRLTDGETVIALAVYADEFGLWSRSDIDVSSLNDGVVTFEASGVGTGEDTAVSYKDTVAPQIGIDSVADPISQGNAAAVVISGWVEPGARVEVQSTDGTSYTHRQLVEVDNEGNWSAEVDVSGLADGAITFNVLAFDTVGNLATDTIEAIKYTVALVEITDFTDPITTASQTNVSVSGYTDPQSTIEVVISDGDNVTSPISAIVELSGYWYVNGIDVSNLSDGQLTLEVTATDFLGNVGFAQQFAIKSTQELFLTIDSVTDPIYSFNFQSVAISGQVTPSSMVEVEVTDGVLTYGPISPFVDGNGSWWLSGMDLSYLQDGYLTVTALALGPTGSEATATYVVEKDTLAPPLEFAILSDPITVENQSNVTAGGETEIGVVVFLYVTDGISTIGPFSVGAPTGSWGVNDLDVSMLRDGELVFFVAANDYVGNETFVERTAVKDTVPPALSIESYPTWIDGTNETNVAISGTAEPGSTVSIVATDGESSISSVSVVVDSEGNWSILAIDVSQLDDGTVTVFATATDLAGNEATVEVTAEKLTGAGVLSILNTSVIESDTDQLLQVTVSLSAPQSDAVLVRYSTADGTATAGSDYTATSGTLTFAPGVTEMLVTVQILGDNLDEADETFSLVLSAPQNASIATAVAIVTILDDDGPAISITGPQSVKEDSGPYVVTVSLASATDQQVTVVYNTADGTATAGSDYVAASGTLTFAPGETSKLITIALIADTVVEPNETFTINLSNAVNAELPTGPFTATIANDDDVPTVEVIAPTPQNEGNFGLTPFVFTVRLSGASDSPITVAHNTANGIAQAGSDYQATSGTLTFAPGQTQLLVTVFVIGDTLIEDTNETFRLDLTNPTGATLKPGGDTATAVIIDDDSAPVITISDTSVAEGDSGTTPLVFTVTLTNPSTQTVTVQYVTQDGTATANGDYIATSGTLTFAANETVKTITVNVVGDLFNEGDETFRVLLSNPTNAAITSAVATGTIINDDTRVPQLTIGAVTDPVDEHNEKKVRASGTADPGVRVSLIVTDGSDSTREYTATVAADGAWSIAHIDASKLGDGTITYIVTATDTAGNAAIATRDATKDTRHGGGHHWPWPVFCPDWPWYFEDWGWPDLPDFHWPDFAVPDFAVPDWQWSDWQWSDWQWSDWQWSDWQWSDWQWSDWQWSDWQWSDWQWSKPIYG